MLFPAKKRKKLFLYVFWAAILSFLAVSIKQYRYQKNMPKAAKTIVWSAQSEPQWTSYLWTWRIEDKHSVWCYIFSDAKDRKYFLYSEQQYQIGQIIYLQANFKAGLTGINLIYNFKKQAQHITREITALQNTNSSISWFFQHQFNYPKRLMMKGYYGTLYEKSSLSLTHNNNSLGIISKIKTSLQEKIIKKYGSTQQAGLILGMLIGDRSEIPKDKYDEFIRSGLVHIIAVSWGNILMLVIFLSAVLFFVPFYMRNFIILSFVILYSLICGMDSSVIRAALMWWLSLLALFRGREVQIRRWLAIACIIMLVINPYFLVYDVWFMLSFAAIFWLLFMQKYSISNMVNNKDLDNNNLKKIKKFIKKCIKAVLNNYFYPTLGASIGVFPVLIFFMGKMNLLWIIWNIFILPIIPFVMIYGLLSVFIHDLFARAFLLKIETWLIDYIYRVSKFLSEHGLYIKVNNQFIKYIVFIIALLWFVLWRFRQRGNLTQTNTKTTTSQTLDTKKIAKTQKVCTTRKIT